MKIKDLINISTPQTEEDLYKIVFYRENVNSWWRTYEWGAYLTQLVPNDVHLNPIRRYCKDINGTYVQIGLQTDSFKKYFPNVEINITDNKIEIPFDINSCKEPIESFTLENYSIILEKWKSTLEIKENKKLKNNADISDIPYMDDNYTIYSIMNEILNYPLVEKTPIDNLTFLSALQKHVAYVINKK